MRTGSTSCGSGGMVGGALRGRPSCADVPRLLPPLGHLFGMPSRPVATVWLRYQRPRPPAPWLQIRYRMEAPRCTRALRDPHRHTEPSGLEDPRAHRLSTQRRHLPTGARPLPFRRCEIFETVPINRSGTSPPRSGEQANSFSLQSQDRLWAARFEPATTPLGLKCPVLVPESSRVRVTRSSRRASSWTAASLSLAYR